MTKSDFGWELPLISFLFLKLILYSNDASFHGDSNGMLFGVVGQL
jgi:hypothetical protein